MMAADTEAVVIAGSTMWWRRSPKVFCEARIEYIPVAGNQPR